MLPPGIFIYKSSEEGLCEASSVETIAESSPLWAAGIERCKGWGDFVLEESEAEFFKADVEVNYAVILIRRCSSTMEIARRFYERGFIGEWGAVVAVEQTGGRGQLRRTWVSPPGNLHASVVLPRAPQEGEWGEGYAGLLSLLCGHIVAGALRTVGAEIKIKWPNDLLQDDRKVGGMLIEERSGVDILGLGMNLAESPSDALMREDRSVPAGVLRTNPPIVGPLSLWESLVNRGKSLYEILLGELKPSHFVSALSSQLAWMGKKIQVCEREGSSYQAEIIGISPEGGLIVRCPDGEEVLFSGSITPL